MKSPRILTVSLLVLLLAGCATSEAPQPAPAERPSNRMVQGEVYDIAKVHTMPIAKVRTPPRYPMNLRKAGVTGEAVIDFVIDRDGFVCNAVPVRATHEAFAIAAVDAVSKWRFRPAMVDGIPVNCHMQVPIVFTLESM